MLFCQRGENVLIKDFMSKNAQRIMYSLMATFKSNYDSYYHNMSQHIKNTFTEDEAIVKISKILKKFSKKPSLFRRLFYYSTKPRREIIQILPCFLAMCVNGNMIKMWDLFHSQNILKSYMESYSSNKFNYYIKKGKYNTKHLKRVIYYEMFQYLDFGNYGQEMIRFLKEKKVFNVFNNKNTGGLIKIKDILNSIIDIQHQIEYDYLYEEILDVYDRKIIKNSSIISSIMQDIKTNSTSDGSEYIYQNFFKFLKELSSNNCINDYRLNLKDYLDETILFIDNKEEKIQILRDIYNDFTSKLFGDYLKIKSDITDFINEKKVKFSSIKNDKEYYHSDDKLCAISFEEFNDDDDVLPFKCKHYFRIDEKSYEMLINMYTKQLNIYCPMCRFEEMHFYYEEESDYETEEDIEEDNGEIEEGL